jgi:hypothetical protein
VEWQIILAFVIVISIIIFTGAFVLYLNIGGSYIAIREARARQAVREKENRSKLDYK